ncbi:MAG: response regulator transcription factor [Treponema sp.]|nr:response regulator transcription factor [Treponema sp.]
MGGRTKILIVDDELMSLDFFDIMLSKLDFTVERAKDGMEGLEKVKRFLPDVILLDNIMPRMTGWELTRILKSEAKYKDIPIIMFSALDDVKDKLAGFELGVDDYITKPFNFSEVLARIRAVLRNRELYAQIVARESRLNLAEELRSDMKQGLSYFIKTIDELDAVIAAISSKNGTEAEFINRATLFHAVSEKSQQARKYVEELEVRLEKIGAEWESLKKNEIGLPLLEHKIRENPVQE